MSNYVNNDRTDNNRPRSDAYARLQNYLSDDATMKVNAARLQAASQNTATYTVPQFGTVGYDALQPCQNGRDYADFKCAYTDNCAKNAMTFTTMSCNK